MEFRTIEPVAEEKPSEPTKTETPHTVAESDKIEMRKSETLSEWEGEHGKYGEQYFGIETIGKTFPLRAWFSIVDNYIRQEIEAQNLDMSPASYQSILSDIEKTIQTGSMDAYERLKKISEYIKVLNKYREIKRKKQSYENAFESSPISR